MRALLIAVGRMTVVALAILLSQTYFVSAQIVSEPTVRTDTLTIDQVISDVLRHNDRLAAARFMQQAAEKRVSATGTWDDPMLTGGVANLPISFNYYEDQMTMKVIGLSQTVSLSGEKRLSKKAARSQAQIAKEDVYSTEVDLAMAARFAYADLYYRTKSLADVAAQYDLLDDVIASAKSRLTTNQGSQEEVLAAQTEQWRLTTEIFEAEHMIDDAQYTLNVLRGLPLDTTIPPLQQPETSELPKDPDAWIAAAKAQYPPLKKLAHQSDVLALSSAAESRKRWPSLELSASYGFRVGEGLDHFGNIVRHRDMISYQAMFSLPVFSWHKQNQIASALQAERQSTDAVAMQKWREVEARIHLLFQMVNHLKESVDLYNVRIIPADQDAFQSALAGYAVNRIPFTDVLNYAATIFKDRQVLNDYGNQFARAMAEIQSFISVPNTISPDTTKNR